MRVFRVPANDRELFVGQLARLVENEAGDAEFTEIVEQGCPAQAAKLARGNAQLARDADGQFRDAVGMLVRPWRFGVDDFRERVRDPYSN